MSTGSAAPEPSAPEETGRRRRLVLAAVAAVVLIAVVVAAVLLSGGDDDTEPAADAGATTSATSSAPAPEPSPTPEPSTPPPASTAPVDVNQPPPTLPAVPLDARGEVGNGVSATITSIEAITSEARGPGQIAGPALRVTVRIANGTGQAIPLDSVTVNAYSGAERAPASPLDDPSRSEFRGSIPAGGSAEGVYVFSVPTSDRDAVTVEVGYTAGAPLLVFSGPVD